jgi:hypothetical protein
LKKPKRSIHEAPRSSVVLEVPYSFKGFTQLLPSLCARPGGLRQNLNRRTNYQNPRGVLSIRLKSGAAAALRGATATSSAARAVKGPIARANRSRTASVGLGASDPND